MSIKKNFFYNSLLTTANYIFPLIVYPYVSRVLGVDGIGICNFVDGIVNYFVLFSAMGITVMGIREIAATKAVDREGLSRKFSSLLVLTGLTTLLMIAALLLCIHLVPELAPYKKLLYVGVLKLVGNLLLLEWFFRGMEDFKYITIRSVIVRSLFVAAVFVFVRSSDDYFTYFLLMTLTTVGNCLFNLVYVRRFVHFSLRGVSFKGLLKPYFELGFYVLLTSMYITFNVVFLGFVAGDVQVGYYTTATKLYAIILAMFTAFTHVMMPRMSSLIAEKRYDDFRRLMEKSVRLLLYFSVPLIVVVEFFAPEIVLIISGEGYEGAIVPLRIVMPLLLVIGYGQIVITQGLMPMKKDRAVTINSAIGATLSVVLNLLLVHSLKSVGSAIAWVCCEVSILTVAQLFFTRYTGIRFPWKATAMNLLYYLPLGVVMWGLVHSGLPPMLNFAVGLALTAFYFLMLHFVKLRDPMLLELAAKVPCLRTLRK